MAKRNRAAQDTTLINLRAVKKRVAVLEREMKALRRVMRKWAR